MLDYTSSDDNQTAFWDYDKRSAPIVIKSGPGRISLLDLLTDELEPALALA